MKVRVMISKEMEVNIDEAGFDNWVRYLNSENMSDKEVSKFLVREACKCVEEAVGLPFGSYNNEETYISAVYDEDYNAILEY